MPTRNPIDAALEAHSHGYVPVPIKPGEKRPAIVSWSRIGYENAAEVSDTFADVQKHHNDPVGVGIVLGEASGGLVDVDLDHPKALRLADVFLPPTQMMTGRPSTRFSHRWYQVVDGLPDSTKKYTMPDGSTIIELRSTGGQTVIPPTIHPSGEITMWEGFPFGGDEGPAEVHGQLLSARVATLAMVAVLLDNWPGRGERHNAYLALAGGLLRYGSGDDVTVHPLWETALPGVIRAIAEATHDDDGADARTSEVMDSTLKRLRTGQKVQGFPSLAGIIGESHGDKVRDLAREIELILGHAARPSSEPVVTEVSGETAPIDAPVRVIDPENRDPLTERISSWEAVDLIPYLTGNVVKPQATIFKRADGKGLFYEGRVNCLYGRSESGKTWAALVSVAEFLEAGRRVMYIDCEDDPAGLIDRMLTLKIPRSQIEQHFAYIRPEDAISRLLVNRWGGSVTTEESDKNSQAFAQALADVEPELIVVDGLTVLYGLHGLDTNGAADTEVITGWMKALTGNGQRAVIIIDHTPKNAGLGATPLGSQHKIAMVQGAAIQVHPLDRPRIGHRAEILLAVGKDRPGQVRAISQFGDPDIAAKMVFDSTDPDNAFIEITETDPQELNTSENDGVSKRLRDEVSQVDLVEVWARKIYEFLEQSDEEKSRSEISFGASLDLDGNAWQAVDKVLIDRLHVTQTRRKHGKFYYSL